jgi:DNA-binding transcriptional LysR family regulator
MRLSDGQLFSEMIAFVAVATCQSYVRAAAKLGVEPPNLSRTISRLEKRVGLRLLHRTTRSVSLTSAGASYLAYCSAAVAQFEQAEQFIHAQRDELSGPLRLSIPMSFGLTRLGPILAGFTRANPGVAVEALLSDDIVDLAAQGIDIALRIGASMDPALHARLLTRTDRILCASPAYLRQHGTPALPQDVARHATLAFANRPNASSWILAREGSAAQTVVVQPVISVNNSLLLRDLALQDMGIAPLAHYVVADALAQRQLVRVLPDWTAGSLNICAVYLSQRNISPAVRAFIDFCVLHMSDDTAQAAASDELAALQSARA